MNVLNLELRISVFLQKTFVFDKCILLVSSVLFMLSASYYYSILSSTVIRDCKDIKNTSPWFYQSNFNLLLIYVINGI